MPIYEYMAERCLRDPACNRRKEYLQSLRDAPLTLCPDCGAGLRRVMSAFAARSGEFGVSTPDPTPLNITNIPAPRDMPAGEGGCSGGHSHDP
ncbi:FmdB family zinc ribbon protein [Candidatus Nitrospira bockiana]